MMPLNNPGHTILGVRQLIESERRSEIKLSANGGNAILIICQPLRELEYILLIKDILPAEKYEIIDLNMSLLNFISQNRSGILECFDLLHSAPQEIFKAPAGEQSGDLFKAIILQIQNAYDNDKVPVLISPGALHGTGIENIHIAEDRTVMNAPFPVVILYPAVMETDKLLFLGKKPVSKYRCMIVE